MNCIAKVAVDLSLDREFDYRIPESLRPVVEIGSRVEVPFGPRSVTGFVVGLTDQSNLEELKPISKVLGEKSLITETVMKLARWMSAYYLAPFEVCVRSVLPAVVRRKANGDKKQLTVSLNVDEIFIPIQSIKNTDDKANEAGSLVYGKLTPKQQAIIQCLEKNGPMLLSELTAATETTASPIKTLEKKGMVKISTESIYRDPHAGVELLKTDPLPLMEQQAVALKQIVEAMSEPEPPVILLHGVTGSGKTEVYLQAIAQTLEQGQGAIVLVPEIALTPQTVDRFRARFADRPERVAVLHSSLSDGERYDEWHRIRSGEAQIVVGARSALFAPIHHLGLIVVDEEHEPTYKQDEAPRYSARDMAVLRGKLEKCAVVLGSATPALESYANATNGKYRCAT
ncbi:MAG: primosomal protein N', partial [Kiritimatiellales bacterium]